LVSNSVIVIDIDIIPKNGKKKDVETGGNSAEG
jgi:hypothetical protein